MFTFEGVKIHLSQLPICCIMANVDCMSWGEEGERKRSLGWILAADVKRVQPWPVTQPSGDAGWLFSTECLIGLKGLGQPKRSVIDASKMLLFVLNIECHFYPALPGEREMYH